MSPPTSASSPIRASHPNPLAGQSGAARGIHGIALTGLRYRPVGELPEDIRRLAGDIR